MENFNNEIFGFGNTANEELEQASNFNYDSISGLGESDYENEDLFSTEVESNNNVVNNNIFDTYYNQEPVNNIDNISNFGVNYVENNDLTSNQNSIYFEQLNQQPISVQEPKVAQFNQVQPITEITNNNQEPLSFMEQTNIDTNVESEQPVEMEGFVQNDTPIQESISPVEEVQTENVPEQTAYEKNLAVPEEQSIIEESAPVSQIEQTSEIQENTVSDPIEEPEETQEITISETPIEELNKLTQYKEEEIEETDINSLFDKVSVNVKDASDIFRKNTDLKQKIDTRFEELKKLQSELENSRQKQLDEINRYKEEVVTKLTEKKEEIERRLNILKESQATLEKEKQEFEEYKKKEQENIDRVQKEVQSAYDDRREELNNIEDVLRKQKDALDEERSQLSLDRIQYESDKNELANNLLKFNELVNSFTNGMNDIKE